MYKTASYNAEKHNRPIALLSSGLRHCSIICRISPASGALVPQTIYRDLAPDPMRDFHPQTS